MSKWLIATRRQVLKYVIRVLLFTFPLILFSSKTVVVERTSTENN